jgi:hypothetical protein
VSVRQIELAWEAPVGGIQKLVLVALADFADDQGGSVFPAVPTLARKCGIDETTCRRTLRGFERDGLIALVSEARQHRPRNYRLQLRAGAAPPLDVARAGNAPSLKAARAGTAHARAGTAHARAGTAPIQGGRSAPQSVIEPSRNQERVAVVDSEQDQSAAGTGDAEADAARARFRELVRGLSDRMPSIDGGRVR